MSEKTTATIKTKYSEVTVQVNKDDLSIDEMIEQIIRPLLRGTGYGDSTINKYFGEIDENAL